MSKLILAAGAAVLAIAAPAHADKGGNGHGNGGGGGDRGGGQEMKANHGGEGGNAGQAKRIEHGRGQGSDFRHQAGNVDREMRGHGNDRRSDVRHAENGRWKDSKVRVNDRIVIDNRDRDRDFDRNRIVSRDFADRDGCPPGLAKKDNGCLPPGQAKKLLGARLHTNFANSLLPYQYRSWYRDDGDHFFRSGDGFIYRVNRSNDFVDGIIPLFSSGNYYSRGETWPSDYNFYNVPYQYRDYYADTGAYNYRYGDGAIYRLNAGTGVIDSIVALLAGDLGVGQQLPQGYDVYNVPFQYRDRYSDTADNWYRYNDGYIYQVDPKTRLISAVIDAII